MYTNADDYADNSATTGLLSVGSQTMGNLELAQDTDWFKIQLQAGTTYVFELSGAASGSGTLSRPYLHLYDSSNYHFSVRSGYNGGTNGDPLFSYTPTTSGDYYLGASDFYDTGTGTYTLKATSESVTSSDTALVTNSNHLPTGNIVIKGAAKVEQILSLTSTLEDADGLGDFSYQWLSNGKEIKNAIQDTYKLLKSDIGSKISVNVSYTDGEGTDELVTSVATAKVVTNISAKPSKGNDQLVGTAKNNKLSSLAGDDTLIGGQGADTLTGGKGADTFIFTAESESWITSTTRETITDFKHSEKDKIDLSAIDANAKLAGDQAFTFIGSAAFSKANSSGQLRFDATSHILYGSTNADNKPEFSIQLNGVNSLVAGDFIL
jgi:Ca2+-binding RTX toxin-like protein